MYSVYAIQSEKDKRIYVGLSSDVDKRLVSHNSGKVFSTKGYRPWKLFFIKKCASRLDAREKEKYFKSGCGKEYLKSIAPK